MSATTDEYVAPASPAGYLMWHILKKGFQAGGVVGAAAVVPSLFLWKKVRDPAVLLRSMGYTALGLTAASGALGGLKFTKIDQAGFEDRAYRLHYNESQNRTDSFSTVGCLLGFAASAAFIPRSTPSFGLTLVGGAAAGCALGVAAHMATKPQEQRHPNKAVHELTRKD